MLAVLSSICNRLYGQQIASLRPVKLHWSYTTFAERLDFPIVSTEVCRKFRLPVILSTISICEPHKSFRLSIGNTQYLTILIYDGLRHCTDYK